MTIPAILVIPWTSSRLVQTLHLSPHPSDSLSNALMQICGRRLVRKRWRLTDSMGTWEIVKLPSGKCAIGSRWFMKVKHNADGSLDCYKARLVAKGYIVSASWL